MIYHSTEMSCQRAEHIHDCIQKVKGDQFLPIWVFVEGGDRELTVTIESTDLRDGGAVDLVFHGYDASKYTSTCNP